MTFRMRYVPLKFVKEHRADGQTQTSDCLCFLQTLFLMDIEQCPCCKAYSFMMQEFTTTSIKWGHRCQYCVLLAPICLFGFIVLLSYILHLSFFSWCITLQRVNKLLCKCCFIYGEQCLNTESGLFYFIRLNILCWWFKYFEVVYGFSGANLVMVEQLKTWEQVG
jgi:hypothetical protein